MARHRSYRMVRVTPAEADAEATRIQDERIERAKSDLGSGNERIVMHAQVKFKALAEEQRASARLRRAQVPLRWRLT